MNYESARYLAMNNYTNEKLAELIGNGHNEYNYLLWQQVEKIIIRKINTIALYHKEIMKSKGVEKQDLLQECYFAFFNATKAFDKATGYKFTTYLEYHIKSIVNDMLGFRTAAGRNDVMSNSKSLNELLSTTDDLTIADTIIDENAAGFKDIDDMLYNKQLHNDLENAINSNLNAHQRYFVKQKYFSNCTTKQLADECNRDMTYIHNILKTSLFKLSKDNILKKYHDDIISCHAYKATGLNAFKNNRTSSVEITIERLYDI